MSQKIRSCLIGFLLFVCVPLFALATTYVFPYEGFRYTRQGNETVLTQTNLNEYTAYFESLGTSTEAVLANYVANGIVMEVIPENGGQIAVSVSDNPYWDDKRSLDDLKDEEKLSFLERFTVSGLYDTSEIADTQPQAIRVTSSALYASMPVYSICYLTAAYGKLYTVNMTVIGRQIEAFDDDVIRSVLSGMQMFEARVRATTEPAILPVTTPEPEVKVSYAKLQNVEGNISLDPVESTVYQDTIAIAGKTNASTGLTVACKGEIIGQTTSSSEGDFVVKLRLPELGENRLFIDAENVHAELTLQYALPLATVRILSPTETTFTGETVLIRGETVPNAIVYFNSDLINTNVTANRYGAFSIRLTIPRAGRIDLRIRSHLNGYTDYSMNYTLERVLTEKEQIAAFRQSVISLEYATLTAQPGNYADEGFIFRGKVMEYTDYNGNPCALVCTANPSTGKWYDPMYIVIESGEAPEIGDVMTFYLIGEGITLPASAVYTRSGLEEEVPVARAIYITTNR